MEFENEISAQLKVAVELGVPKKFLNEKNENMIPQIVSLIDAGKNLNELYAIFTNIFPEDLAMIYAKREENLMNVKDVLKNINDFYTTLELNKILDVNELRLLKEEWDRKYANWVQKDAEDYDRIVVIQEELGQYEPLQRSPIKIESTIIFAEMKFKRGESEEGEDEREEEKSPSVADGYEVFDLSYPNRNLPYIKWRTNMVDIENRELIKVYKGETEEELPDFSKIVHGVNLKEAINTFYFTVWKGKNLQENISRESFMKSSYNLETNLLKLKVPTEEIGDKNVILKRITDALPLEPKNIFEKSISAELFIYDISVNLLILSHMVYNDELFNNYLFVKEMGMTNIYSTKNTIKMFFRSVKGDLSSASDEPNSSVSFYVNQLTAKGGDIVTILNEDEKQDEKIKLSAGSPYLQIKITAAESLEVAERFVGIFTRLLNRYKEEYGQIEKLYLSYIPEFLEFKTVEVSRRGGRDSETKIARLKQAAPDLFIADYARKCLCQFQPIPIADDEIEEWENKTFFYKGEQQERQVLRFPPDNPRWNFVCPDDRYPFPGVKVNKLPNKALYPGLPCCFVNDQMNYDKSNYSKIYGKGDVVDKGIEEVEDEEREEDDVGLEEALEGRAAIDEEDEDIEEAALKREEAPLKALEKKEIEGEFEERDVSDIQKIKTDKIAQPGRYGSVPNSIVELLRDEVNDLRRRGVIRSPNSLLHCISIAVQDKNYINEKDKERYVRRMRETIAESTFPGLLKQELYDFDLESISEKVESEDFLDPNLYFRMVEEAYGINIFVFAPSLDEAKRLRNKEESAGALVLSRCKLFSARSPRLERPSICIYRTMGSESDMLTYPQCELLVGTQGDKEVSIFRESGTDTLYRAMANMYKTISWELVHDERGVDIIGRDNLYSRINYYALMRKAATKQYIDEYGKMRGLYVGGLLVVIPPSQPENLEVSDEIVRGGYKEALSLFGQPVAVSMSSNLIDGLWYSVLDLSYGIYIPIQSEARNVFKNLPVGPSNPLGENAKEKSARIIKLKRDLDFILQILKWLYILSGRIGVDEFLNKYTTTLPVKYGDSSEIYDFSNLGRKFPDVKNVEEGIVEMKKRVPTLFTTQNTGNKIYVYSDKMLKGLKYLLEQYVKEYVKNYTPIPVTIKRKHLTEQDFVQHADVALFFNERDMKVWLENLKRNYEIFTTITVSHAVMSDPYIYQAPDKHIYLVQNVLEGDMQRALNVGYYWDKYHVNPGFRTPEYDEAEELKYVIYTISPANTIIPYENHAGDSLSFLSVLRYNEFAHAAMIRLL